MFGRALALQVSNALWRPLRLRAGSCGAMSSLLAQAIGARAAARSLRPNGGGAGSTQRFRQRGGKRHVLDQLYDGGAWLDVLIQFLTAYILNTEDCARQHVYRQRYPRGPRMVSEFRSGAGDD